MPALASPTRTARLTRAEMGKVAAGALMAVLIAGCGFFGPDAPPWHADPSYRGAADARSVRGRLDALRQQYNRSPSTLLQDMQWRFKLADERIAGGAPPEWALEHILQGGADEGERDMRFWMLRVEDPAQLRFPADLMRPMHLTIAIGLFRQQEGNHPRYLVVLVTPSLDEYRVDVH